ncbi:hypothetical protein [Acinetobacter sp. B51(2017)]|uniref:hypothetical protein n=1 Tax=Acinetobacter sp. B51(2017) TaxID=2060938 RepID=UPI000F0744E8|nr:hypothetical protein [Acinetobacter sp. B51(2017)]
MHTDLWAVICGNIRDELDFKLTLTRIVELRLEGKIQHIVLSTWKGEIDKYAGLREQLAYLQVYLIENPAFSPQIEATASESVNYWRQARQLLAALDMIPKQDFILRLRTDRSLNYINQMDKLGVFGNYQQEAIKLGQFPRLFKYKVTVFGPKMVRLLHMIDFVLLGNNRDLYRLINFDFAELGHQKQIVANAQWFAVPFLKEFPILRDYMRFTHFVNRVKVLKTHVDLHKENAFFPAVYYKVYAIYLMILYTHFNILYTGRLKQADYSQIHFYELFSSTANYGIQHTSLGSSIRDQNILEYFLFGKLKDSSAYRQFKQKVTQLIAYGADEQFDLTFEDYKELVDLSNDNFYETSEEIKWFKRLRRPPINLKRLYQYNTDIRQATLNFIDEDDEQWMALTHTESIEKDIYKVWLNLDNPSVTTTEKMLLPIARTGNEYAIYVLLDLLDKNQITAINQDEIKRIVFFYLDIHMRRRTETLQTTRIIILLLKMQQQQKIQLDKLEKMLQCGFDRYITLDDLDFNEPIDDLLQCLKHKLEQVQCSELDKQHVIQTWISQISDQQLKQEVVQHFQQKSVNDAMILSKKWVVA